MSSQHSLSRLGDLITVPNLASNSPPSAVKRTIPTMNTNNSPAARDSAPSSSTTTTPTTTNNNNQSNNNNTQNNKQTNNINNGNSTNNNNTQNGATSLPKNTTQTNNQLITQNNSMVPDSQEEQTSPVVTFGRPSFSKSKGGGGEEEELTPLQESGNNSDVFDESDDDVICLGSQPSTNTQSPGYATNSQMGMNSRVSSSDSDSDEVSQITPVKSQRKRKTPGSAPTPSPLYSSSSDDDISDLELDSIITLRTEVSSQTPPAKVKKSTKTQTLSDTRKKVIKVAERMKKRRSSHPSRKTTPPSASLQHALQLQNQPIPIGSHPLSLPHNPDHFRALSYPFQHFGASASTVGPSFNPMNGMENFSIQHSQMIQTLQMPPPMSQPQPLHSLIPHPQNDPSLPPPSIQQQQQQPMHQPMQQLQHHQIHDPITEFPNGCVPPPIDLNSSIINQQQPRAPESSNAPSASTVPSVDNTHPALPPPADSNTGYVKGERVRGAVSTNALVQLIMKFGPYCDNQVLLSKIFNSMKDNSIEEMCTEDVIVLVLTHTPKVEKDKKLEKEWTKKLGQKTLGAKWKQLLDDYPELIYYNVYKLKPDKIRIAIQMDEALQEKFSKKKHKKK